MHGHWTKQWRPNSKIENRKYWGTYFLSTLAEMASKILKGQKEHALSVCLCNQKLLLYAKSAKEQEKLPQKVSYWT